MSRNKTDVDFFVPPSCLKHVHQDMKQSVVVHPILPPKWCEGSNWCFSVRYEHLLCYYECEQFHHCVQECNGPVCLGYVISGLA